MRNQYKVIDNNDINRSFNSNPHSKLSSNMNIKNQKKKIHSHCLNDFEKIKFNNKAILENGIKEIPLPSTIINTKQDPSKSDYENLIPKKPLLEKLDYDQYKEIEEELNVLKEIQNFEDNFQNEQKCKIYFLNLKIVEFSIALFCIISFSSSIIYHQFKTYDINNNDLNKDYVNKGIFFSIILVSISTLFHCILTVIRYYIIIDVKKASLEISKIENIYSTGNLKYLLLEITFALIHPNIGFHYIYFTTSYAGYLQIITYNFNDFIILILFLRCYTIFRFLFCLSKYYGARASRVLHMVGLELTRSFSMKCLMEKISFLVLLIVVTVFVTIFSFMIRIVEGPAFFVDATMQKNNINFNIFQNCVWCVLVTMTTVGYGDYYPVTNLGRLIMIITAIVGNIIISLIIVSMQRKFEFSENEQKAFDKQSSLILKNEIEKYSVLLFQKNCRYKIAKKRFINSFCSGFYSKKYMLKLRSALEDSLYQKIKIKKIFKNKLHQYQNLYEAKSENDYIQEKLELMRENIVGFVAKYDQMEKNLLSIKELIDGLNTKQNYKSFNL